MKGFTTSTLWTLLENVMSYIEHVLNNCMQILVPTVVKSSEMFNT